MINPVKDQPITHYLHDLDNQEVLVQEYLAEYTRQFSLLIIGLDDTGPAIRASQSIPWHQSPVNNYEFLTRFSLDTVILGMRDEYKNSVSDIPAPGTDAWRAIVFSINFDDTKFQAHEAFLQVVIFIPLTIHRKLSSISSYGPELLDKITSMVTPTSQFDDDLLNELRDKILSLLLANVNGKLYP